MSGPGIRKILCAVDFSPISQNAVDKAHELATKTGASITLIHVVHLPVALTDADHIPAERAYLDAQLTASARLLATWQRDLAARGAGHVDVIDQNGAPWERIVHAADAGSFDLIVLGTQGRTGLARMLLGSTAERVVRHAPCSVLVVRPASA